MRTGICSFVCLKMKMKLDQSHQHCIVNMVGKISESIFIHVPFGSVSIHRSTHDPLNQNQLCIVLASEIYGVTMHTHTAHSERVYQTDDDCPMVHLLPSFSYFI
jgi:hypothetical protein